MALGFSVCAVPDSHIAFLRDHPGLGDSYLEGVAPPVEVLSSPLPADWPVQPPAVFDQWCVNHRNTGLYHWILNGSSTPVDGVGALFQTWHDPNFASSIVKLDKHNEHFALYSYKVGELAALVQRVDLRSVHRAFVEWCKSEGKRHDDIDDLACQPFVDEFTALGRLLSLALLNEHGVIW